MDSVEDAGGPSPGSTAGWKLGGEFHNALHAHPNGALIVDEAGVVTWSNPAAQAHFGVDADLVGVSFGLPVTGDDHVAEIEVRSTNGTFRVLQITTTPLRWRDGSAQLITTNDISKPKRQITTLERHNERLALAMEGSNDGLWDWDLVDRSLHVSRRWREILGLDHLEQNDHEPAFWLERIHGSDRYDFDRSVEQHLARETELLDIQIRVRHENGDFVWMLCRGKAVFDGSKAVRLAGSITDISERKRLEDELRHEAHHDTLTGVANRRLLLESLDAASTRYARSHTLFALALLDLDGFKMINDELGHAAGDEVLVEVARRIKRHIRPHDVAARLGGDEFAILLVDLRRDDLEHIARRLHDALADPHELDGQQRSAPASIGISVPTGRGSSSDLLRTADDAMYRAKQTGRPIIAD